MIRMLIALMLFIVAPLSLAAAPLVAPPGFSVAPRSGKAPHNTCPADAVPFTKALDFKSKYEGSDKARDDLNASAESEFRGQVAPISALEKGFSQQVDDYMRSGDEAALGCALDLLKRWSSAHALEGEARTHTGKSMRKWALASVAAAYLRLKTAPNRPLQRDPETAKLTEAWIGRLADRVVSEWKGLPLEKTNNHAYWAAWSVMASAVVLDRRDLFDWAIAEYRTAAKQIDANGMLPNELKRDTRALFYHNYALTPLTMLAAFAKANGVDVASENKQALQRLAQRVLAGTERPQEFQDRTGKKQFMGDLDKRSSQAWLEPYCWTLGCDGALAQRLATARPLKSYRLGGNLTDLFSASAPLPGVTSRSPR